VLDPSAVLVEAPPVDRVDWVAPDERVEEKAEVSKDVLVEVDVWYGELEELDELAEVRAVGTPVPPGRATTTTAAARITATPMMAKRGRNFGPARSCR
jgi:hypothetical protein